MSLYFGTEWYVPLWPGVHDKETKRQHIPKKVKLKKQTSGVLWILSERSYQKRFLALLGISIPPCLAGNIIPVLIFIFDSKRAIEWYAVPGTVCDNS